MARTLADITSGIAAAKPTPRRSFGVGKRRQEALEFATELTLRYGAFQPGRVPGSMQEIDRYSEHDRSVAAGSGLDASRAYFERRLRLAAADIEESYGSDVELRSALLAHATSVFATATSLTDAHIARLDAMLAEVETYAGGWESHGDRILDELKMFAGHNGAAADFLEIRERAYRAFRVSSFEAAANMAVERSYDADLDAAREI